jgi:molecular chaperone DnaK (HSP70)
MAPPPPDARYVVGIDLGTTNCALAYVDLENPSRGRRRIALFDIPQITGQNEISRLPVLPSFCYLPGAYDLPADAARLPWNATPEHLVGIFARDHGAQVPARLVSSAKSWLCHGGVDRNAPILPWGSGDEVVKISPVQATAAYLDHLRRAWNHFHRNDENARLEDQLVTITVPASFDEVARELTMTGARMAGLQGVTLLEEPLAAFYSWLLRNEEDWSAHVAPGELVVVCDVGGGTTDFTLISLRKTGGSPRFERIAVGDHLILGGDNIDLALARRLERQMGRHQALSNDRWKTLCHLCRHAKESILSGDADSRKITLMGSGSQLIAGTLSGHIDREMVEDVVLDGFFPVDAKAFDTETPEGGDAAGFGLPHEKDPAITRHLGRFLDRHKEAVQRALGRSHHHPELILFNGGSLKPGVIQDRFRAAIRQWFATGDPEVPRILENRDPELAVAEGAAYYGLVKLGMGVRVGSGSPRSYYLGIVAGSQNTGDDPTRKGATEAICLVERGLEEGSSNALTAHAVEVRTNQPVRFDLYSSSYRSGDRFGDLIPIDATLTPMAPIQTVIQFGQQGKQTRIPVHIEAHYTEYGTLALWCRSTATPHRWQLQFQLRDGSVADTPKESQVFDEAVVAQTNRLLSQAFTGPPDKDVLARMTKRIGEVAGAAKEDWPLGLMRRMADHLLERVDSRKRSPAHEARWLNLVGFCLRPGFGDGLDGHRIKRIWKQIGGQPVHGNKPQVQSEWWVFWRRLAGGLGAGHQRQFLQQTTPVLSRRKGRTSGGRPSAQQRLEIWMTLASLERLMAKDKIVWAVKLLDELKPKNARPQHFWALGRFGARELLYGPADRVVPPAVTKDWIYRLTAVDWRNPEPVAAALKQLGRLVGDRSRDHDPATREHIRNWLEAHQLASENDQCLQEVIPMSARDGAAVFGESLPLGLVLRTDDGRAKV